MENIIQSFIKDVRRNAGFTLQELSDRSGVQVATLSRIENGKMTGTIESHRKIAEALDLTLTELYEAPHGPGQKNGSLFSRDPSSASKPDHLPSGITIHPLRQDSTSKALSPCMITLKRGARTPVEKHAKAERFLYIVKGRLNLSWGDRKLKLRKGASVTFDASAPHSFLNIGKKSCRFISVLSFPQ